MQCVDDHLPAEAHGSAVLSSVCIFIKADNGNAEGGNLSTPNRACSGAFIEENKPQKENQNVHTRKRKALKLTPAQVGTTCGKKINASISLIWLFFSPSPVLFHGMLLSPPGGEGWCYSGN